MNKKLSTIFFVFALLYVSAAQFGIQELAAELQQNLMVEYINSVQTQWVAGKNFEPAALQNYQNYLGLIQKPNNFPTISYLSSPLQTIPDTFDSRVQWPNCKSIQTIRDQGNCGSCWAVSAVEAMSDRICISSNQTSQVYLSDEQMVACVPNGCEGGEPSDAWNYYVQNGLCTGAPYGQTTGCQPYTFPACGVACQKEPFSATPTCESTCISQYTTSFTNDLHFGTQVYNVNSDVTDIQTEIMTNGPVQGTMDVYADFMTYKSGVYAHTTGDYLGGHAIKIIGWGVENGVDYWLCANSWDLGFGIDGYFMIQRGTDESGIEDGCVAGTPATSQTQKQYI